MSLRGLLERAMEEAAVPAGGTSAAGYAGLVPDPDIDRLELNVTALTLSMNGGVAPPPPVVSLDPITPAAQAEGTGAGANPYTITVRRVGSLLLPTAARLRTRASAGSTLTAADFVGGFHDEVVTLGVGVATLTRQVQPVRDALDEADEAWEAYLTDVVGGTLGTAVRSAAITNDDAPVSAGVVDHAFTGTTLDPDLWVTPSGEFAPTVASGVATFTARTGLGGNVVARTARTQATGGEWWAAEVPVRLAQGAGHSTFLRIFGVTGAPWDTVYIFLNTGDIHLAGDNGGVYTDGIGGGQLPNSARDAALALTTNDRLRPRITPDGTLVLYTKVGSVYTELGRWPQLLGNGWGGALAFDVGVVTFDTNMPAPTVQMQVGTVRTDTTAPVTAALILTGAYALDPVAYNGVVNLSVTSRDVWGAEVAGRTYAWSLLGTPGNLTGSGASRVFTAVGVDASGTVRVQSDGLTLDAPVSVQAIAGSRFVTRQNPDGSTIQVELPRGVTSAYDMRYDEATHTLVGTLWDWTDQRIGGARHQAVPAGNRRTVAVDTPANMWAQFKAHVAEFAAGTGDWTIRAPGGTYLMDDQWSVPAAAASRRLFIENTTATLVADVMPSTADLDAQAMVFLGPTFSRNHLWEWSNGAARISVANIVWRPQNAIALGVLTFFAFGGVTSLDSFPSGNVIERFWIDGAVSDADPVEHYMRRGILANTRLLTLLEGWITDIRQNGSETCAMNGWSGAQHQYCRNVLYESTSIGKMYGGADPAGEGSGLYDPSDNVDFRTAESKKLSWMTPGGQSVKNGKEAKNVKRWLIIDGATFRATNLGQHFGMLFQSLSGAAQAAVNTCSDVAVINYRIRRTQAGLGLAARPVLGGSTQSANPSARLAFVDIVFEEMGYHYNAGAVTVTLQIGNDFQGLILDRWTQLPSTQPHNAFMVFSYDNAPGPSPQNVQITNIVAQLGEYGIRGNVPSNAAPVERRADQLPLIVPVGLKYDGNLFYGGIGIDGSPGRWSPGGVYYASLADAGVDSTTGVITPGSPAATAGTGGGPTGARMDRQNAMLAAIPWAFSR